MTHWVNKYIGIPYCRGGRSLETGLDCWGLVRLVYQQEKGIELPLFPGIVEDGPFVFAREIERNMEKDWKEVSVPQELEVAVMSQREVFHHVGVWTSEFGGKVIHTFNEKRVVAEGLRSLKLRGFRAIKFMCYGARH